MFRTTKTTLQHISRTLVLMVLLAVISACSTSTTPQTQNTLTLNIGAEPSFLNPILSTDSASSSVGGLVFSGLMKVDEQLEMVPDLTERYTISPDGKTYTFHLKETVLWHDNTPFTADDVLFTFQKILDPTTNTVRRSNYMIDGQEIQFKKIDTYTIQAILPKAFAPFLTHMGMGIIPKHIFENDTINQSPYNRKPIGTGPFMFVEWKPSQHVLLQRNDRYYWKKPKLERILLKIIPDRNTSRISLEKGELDIEDGIQAKDYALLEKNKALGLYRYYAMNYSYIGFNLKAEPFNNKTFRQAVAHAINRPALIRGVLKEFGVEALLPSSPVMWSYPEKDAISIFPFNPEKSHTLIKEMGYTFNTKTKFYEKDGTPLSFSIITNKGNKYREKTAQIVQRYLQNVGVKVSIQLMEWSSFLKVMHDPDKHFDAVIVGWSLGLDPDGYSIWHSSQYPNGFNYIGYNNPTVDTLLEKGRTTINRDKRKAIYSKIYKEITTDIPYYFLYHPEVITAANKRVGGILENPGPLGIIKDIEDIYIKDTTTITP